MNHLLNCFFVVMALSFFTASEAQQTKKTSSVKKEKTAPKKSAVNKEHTPTETERLEDTKVDVVSPVINFDTSAAPNDNFTKTIMTLLTVTGALENDVKMVEQSLNSSLGNDDSKQVQEFKKRFILEMKEGRARTWLTNLYIRTYRKLFTEAELLELIQFYQTPLGKKVTQNLPLLMENVLADSQKIGTYLGQKVMQEITEQNSNR